MNDLTFTILKIVVSVCASLITVYLIPYLNKLLENEKYSQIKAVIETAVSAAEKTIKKGGAEKKAMVLDFVQTWLSQEGIIISYEQLDALIEEAVYNLT